MRGSVCAIKCSGKNSTVIYISRWVAALSTRCWTEFLAGKLPAISGVVSRDSPSVYHVVSVPRRRTQGGCGAKSAGASRQRFLYRRLDTLLLWMWQNKRGPHAKPDSRSSLSSCRRTAGPWPPTPRVFFALSLFHLSWAPPRPSLAPPSLFVLIRTVPHRLF